MIEKDRTQPSQTGADPQKSRLNNGHSLNQTDRIYRIACTLRALTFKGVERGDIPGINPEGFCADELNEFLQRNCRVWSSGEVLLLEFLLNLYDPYQYTAFNFGRALNVLDPGHMSACIKAAVQYYNGE